MKLIMRCVLLSSLWMLMTLSGMVFAQAQPRYPFKTPQQRHTFQQLLTELRCLVCQNQNLANSQAGLAEDLRQQIYQQVLAGQSATKIKQQLVGTYGQFILFKPAISRSTILLWGFPVGLCVVGGMVLVWVIRRYRHSSVQEL